MRDKASIAALGLGGNIGDPIAAMSAVISSFDQSDLIDLLAVSKLYRTPPWGKIDQPDFYNACVLVQTTLQPVELLDLCLSLELELKRERIERWGPRTIDIDLLTYGDEEIELDRLVVPHPRMTERAFVLMPLTDIVKEHIVNGRSIGDWLRNVDQSGIEAMSQDGSWWQRPPSL
jgi:2-amino-4-hydroxy-6-hydroxymethyldihydropteridine diphosphokinase